VNEQHFEHSDAVKLEKAMSKITEPDLLVLKAHASIEHMIRCLLAARLGGDPKDLERLGAALATKLALLGLQQTAFGKVVATLGTLRNRIAHKIDSAPFDQVSGFIAGVRAWTATDKSECRYAIPQSPTTGGGLDQLRWSLLTVFNHLCHLRAEVKPHR